MRQSLTKPIFPIFLLLAIVSLLFTFNRSSLAYLAVPADANQPPSEFPFPIKDTEPPVDGQPLAATPCIGGTAGSFPCNNVDLLAQLPLNTIGGGAGTDIWGWTDPMDGTEYALMGRTNGTAFVDLSDPENPIYLGNLPTQTGTSTWRDIKVYQNHAFIVSDGNGNHGIQIFDLTELRNVTNPPVTFSNTAHYTQIGSAHNIVINEETGYAYAVGVSSGTTTCSGGLHMIDISTPTSPSFAGCFSADGYTHDAQCVVYQGPDTTHQGREICFNANADTLTIVDVENKGAPVQLSRTGYAGSGYTHQGWITDDHRYFLLDDELDEINSGVNTTTYIWDISDLDNPVNFDNYVAAVPSTDHNLYVKGAYAYLSNYSSGLRILSISDIANGNLVEEAYFDTYPPHNNNGFSGQWSNYPFFQSGIVIASDRQNGLFILQPTSLTPDFSLNATPGSLDVCAPAPAVYQVTVGDISGFGQAVTLSTAGEPSGTTTSFDVNGAVPAFTSTLTITNTGAAATGSYTIDIIGTAPTATHTATVQLDLDAAPGAAPSLSAPINGATDVSQTPSFSWTAVSGSSSYQLDVATDAAFTNIVYAASESGTNHTIPGGSPLDYATTYFWRVSAQNDCGPGPASTTFDFTTLDEPPSYGVLLTPDADGAGQPGTAVSYTLWLTNTGTTTDTFTIAASSIWPTAPAPDAVTLVEGESTTIVVTVDIPASAAHQSTDTAAVTATSTGDPGVSTTATLNTTAVVLAPLAIDLVGPVSGTIDVAYTFTATITPLSTTLPLTVTWTADDQPATTQSLDQLTVPVTYTWSVTGTKSITITVENGAGSVTTVHTITISSVSAPSYTIFLPIIMQNEETFAP